MEAAGTRLLDESQPFDVAIFDGVVSASYDPRHPERSMANEILMKLREQSNAWAKADAIIENSTLPQGRFFGLMALDDAINTRAPAPPDRARAVAELVGRVDAGGGDDAAWAATHVATKCLGELGRRARLGRLPRLLLGLPVLLALLGPGGGVQPRGVKVRRGVGRPPGRLLDAELLPPPLPRVTTLERLVPAKGDRIVVRHVRPVDAAPARGHGVVPRGSRQGPAPRRYGEGGWSTR